MKEKGTWGVTKLCGDNTNVFIMAENGDDADDIVVDRSCIGCDNCGVGSPQKCCARCKSFYYCR